MRTHRRDFLKVTTAGVGALAVRCSAEASPLPERVLGKTGVRVSILGFGGGSRFMMYEDEEEALRILSEAIDSGIRYLDTAAFYAQGRSEERYGKILRHRRRDVFVATKVVDRSYDDFMRTLEQSLRRLQTDRVDLLHIHGLEDHEDLAQVEAPGGCLKALYRARDEKMARFIGVTCHARAEALRSAIERHDLDCVMMALNAATRTGFATDFERVALPAAREKNLGILAMKVTGQDQLVGSGPGRASMRDLLRYSLSLPVASCIVGMPRPEFLRENLEIARDFSPLTEEEKESIRSHVEAAAARLDRFFLHHFDA